MLHEHYRQIGIARVYVEDSPYGWYWVTKFGATDDGTGGTPSPTPPPTATPTAPPATVPPQTPANTPVTTPTAAAPNPTPSQGFAPPPTPVEDSIPIELARGFNLIAWKGPDVSPAEALAGMQGDVIVVYGFDPATGFCSRYSPGSPSYVNTLERIGTGTGYWIFVE